MLGMKRLLALGCNWIIALSTDCGSSLVVSDVELVPFDLDDDEVVTGGVAIPSPSACKPLLLVDATAALWRSLHPLQSRK